jgi:hypothetical protein
MGSAGVTKAPVNVSKLMSVEKQRNSSWVVGTEIRSRTAAVLPADHQAGKF